MSMNIDRKNPNVFGCRNVPTTRLTPAVSKRPCPLAAWYRPSATGGTSATNAATSTRRTAAMLVSSRSSTTNMSTAATTRAVSVSVAARFTEPTTLSRHDPTKKAKAASATVMPHATPGPPLREQPSHCQSDEHDGERGRGRPGRHGVSPSAGDRPAARRRVPPG